MQENLDNVSQNLASNTNFETCDIFSENIIKISEKYNLLMKKILEKQKDLSENPIFNQKIINTYLELWLDKLKSHPETIVESQFDYTKKSMAIMDNIMQRFMGAELSPLYQPLEKDSRFKDKEYSESIFFDYVKQNYLMTAEWIQELIDHTAGLTNREKEIVSFYTKQFVNAFSPTNFILTNPRVLKETIDSKGENLLRGIQKLIEDVEKSHDVINITTTNKEAFEIGKNIAVTEGKVIYQNKLIQLIYYKPQKETYEIPLLIIPPWINKFYILDLTAQNSFVKWIVDQGYSVFLISWVNPDNSMSDLEFEDYMDLGVLEAIKQVQKIFNTKVNAVGYCIGGTLLASTLGYLKAHKKLDIINSASFITTLIDFSDTGELSIFINEPHLALIENQMERFGFFDENNMALAFSLLRSNDLIWNFFVNNYLLGKEPLAFDLLFWNSDSTRLPAKMHKFYLNNMYKDNNLIKSGKIKLKNTPIDLSKIDTKCYFVSAIEDHIAPWKTTFSGYNIFKNSRFVLAGSGHVAGVINHPNKNKYFYFTNEEKSHNPSKWLDNASRHDGSWWVDFDKWCKKLSGKKIDNSKHYKDIKTIEAAPGSYVKNNSAV